AAWPEAVARIERQVAAEKDAVIAAGGLAVIGTERHESRRIDNQLRGRSGRQGDPGSTRFYLSLEDDLMRLFKGEWVNWILQTMKIPDDVPIENKRVTKSIASAQGLVEAQNFETRKNILKYDDVMSAQREVVYAQRRRVLEGEDLEPRVRQMIEDVTGAYVTAATEGYPSSWELDKLWTALGTLYPISLDADQVIEQAGGIERIDSATMRRIIVEDALAAYDKREAELGDEMARELERRVVMSVLDRKWREHLYEMDYLREGIGLRAYSQRDPLVEYQREGYDLFNAMMEGISEESVGYLFNLSVEIEVEEDAEGDEGPHIMAKGLEPDTAPKQLSYSAPSEDGTAMAVEDSVGEDDDELDPNEAARQAKAKDAARRKAKAARQSRKKNR